MGGLTMEKLFLIAVIAVFIVGPERLPHYALQLGRLTKRFKALVNTAKERAAEELGPDFDVDWKQLDPRQYDPRRIIREALTDDPDVRDASPGAAGQGPDLLPGEPVAPPKFTGVSLGGTVSRPGRRTAPR
jgi:sec-independent protein translocase protein TatB